MESPGRSEVARGPVDVPWSERETDLLGLLVTAVRVTNQSLYSFLTQGSKKSGCECPTADCGIPVPPLCARLLSSSLTVAAFLF